MKKRTIISQNENKENKNGNFSSAKEQKFLSKKNFKKALEKAGYNQKTLAEDIYINKATISKWISETNPQPISDNHLLSLARQLYVPKDYLLGKTDDSTPKMQKLYNKISEENKAKRDFIGYLGFKKSVYREQNGKFYCMFINEKEKSWKYCDEDYLNFLEDQIINFGYNLLNEYFNSEMVNKIDNDTSNEIEEARKELHRELWGYDVFRSTHAITRDSEEFNENFEVLEEHPEYYAEEVSEKDGEVYYKIKGSWIKASEVPPALTVKQKKKKPTEEEIVNQKRLKRLAEKYSQEETKKKDK